MFILRTSGLILLSFFTGLFNLSAQPDKTRTVTLGIMTDCQYCNCATTGLRNYRLTLLKLDSCAAVFRTEKPDHIFHLGDLIDHDFRSYDSVLPRMEQMPRPVHHVLGNHDYVVNKSLKHDVPSKLGLNETWYSVDADNWQLIVLNGDDISYQAPQTKAQKALRGEMVSNQLQSLRCNPVPWGGGIGPEQMTWLEHQLSAADSGGRKVVVMCHFPLFPRTCFTLWNDIQVLQLLIAHPCVKAYFCGHYHAGNYGVKEGVHFVNFKGMVDTPVNSFAVVRLTSDSILIKGYGRETDRALKIR